MNEWTVVTVIIALVGLFFTVGKPIMQNQKAMDKLRFDTDKQEGDISDNVSALKELSKIAQAHENRLQLAEAAIEKMTISMAEYMETHHSYETRLHDLERDMKRLYNHHEGELTDAENYQ